MNAMKPDDQGTRRGRRQGSRTKVLRTSPARSSPKIGSWGRHHFAYLRAVVQRMPERDARVRFLGFQDVAGPRSDTPDASFLTTFLDVLCGDALGKAPSSADGGVAMRAAVEALRAFKVGEEVPSAPSLESFIADSGLPEDFYTQREWHQLYLDDLARREPVKVRVTEIEAIDDVQRVRAVNLLEREFLVPLQAGDRLEKWLTSRMARRLGGGTVGALSRSILAEGRRWYRPLAGVGPVQAGRLAEWLDAVLGNGHVAALRRAGKAGRPAAVARRPTLAQLARRFGAVDPWLDMDAAQAEAWLDGRGKAARMEVERFLLWLHAVEHSALPFLANDSVVRYLAWASALTPSDTAWVREQPFEHSDPRWRPFRRAPGARSLIRARSVLRRFAKAAQYMKTQ
jgi:hypothetical protein